MCTCEPLGSRINFKSQLSLYINWNQLWEKVAYNIVQSDIITVILLFYNFSHFWNLPTFLSAVKVEEKFWNPCHTNKADTIKLCL